jgi:hypothetical protein
LLIRFSQATRHQYINFHISFGNRYVLPQEHVDYKFADTLLKKGSKENVDGWDEPSVWTHMVLHLSRTEDTFGETFYTHLVNITKNTVFYTTTSRFVV